MKKNETHIALDVARELHWLRAAGFTKTEDRFDPDQDFGNSFATYTNGQINIRFARDRGDDLASVSSPLAPNNWYILEQVCELTTGKKPTAPTLADLGELFRQHLQAITQALGPNFEQTKPQLEKLYEKEISDYINRTTPNRATTTHNDSPHPTQPPRPN